MYGEEPSAAARVAAELFSHEGKTAILELGGGHGRDSLFFARRGFRVTVLDYSAPGVASITEKAEARGYAQTITVMTRDVRRPLPLPDASVDGCYSYMLFSMAMTTQEIETLTREVWRVLRPGDSMSIPCGIPVIRTMASVSTTAKIGMRREDSRSISSVER